MVRTKVLKATVYVCTSCTVWSLSSKCGFQHSSSLADCTVNARLVSKSGKIHKNQTQKSSVLPTDSFLNNSMCNHNLVLKASICCLSSCHHRHCFASCNCCHDPFIARSAQTRPQFIGFIQLAHPSRCSRSTLAIVCFCARVSRSAAPITRSIIGPPPSSCSGVWDPWSVEYQSCKLAMLLWYYSRVWLRSNICAVLRCRDPLDTEVSVLNSFLYPTISCINVLRSLSCSQSIRQRIRRRTATLFFNLQWNSQIFVHRSQG